MEFNRQGYFTVGRPIGPARVTQCQELLYPATDLRQHESTAKSLKRSPNEGDYSHKVAPSTLMPLSNSERHVRAMRSLKMTE